MSFDTLFRLLSYTAVFCGFAALWISGTFGLSGTALFFAVVIAAWFLEGSRFQISERLGTVMIVAAIPLFYVFWKYRIFDFSSTQTMLPGILARLILTLTAIKLLQKKSDRDWIFLYVMAFFEVLLAAGMSISALYLGVFVAYVFVMVCTIILFEIRRTGDTIRERSALEKGPGRSSLDTAVPIGRLPGVAVALILAILLVAVPMFFMLPRVGGAGIGGGQGDVSTSSGFSDRVQLGGIGRIQQNDAVVMRVRIDDPSRINENFRWRGLALDIFDNRSWSRSKATYREVREKGERDVIQLDYLTGQEGLLLQTFYLEPLDAPVLFVLPRAVGVQGNFPVLFRDTQDSVSFHSRNERITYKVLSDTSLPPVETLRADRAPLPRSHANYLQLPDEMDGRIAALAADVTREAANPYDAAAATELYLQTQFGYTLEQKAGGDEPLADFLFNVREGHCEYFATAMAIMLRTQGVATRVVNGFQRGEYNETADVFVVRQLNAHSWVEVYFPAEDVWVPFDPTPFAGQNLVAGSSGIAATFGKYFEALEMFWIQYFVAFDNQEQRSLFTSIRRGVADYNARASSWMTEVQDAFVAWWGEVRGDSGSLARVTAIGYGAMAVGAAVLFVLLVRWSYRKLVRSKVWWRLWQRLFARRRPSVVEFYERMQRVLAGKGLVRQPHQTPLEFAFAIGMPEAVKITEKYNRVRFGEEGLSSDEADEIEDWLGEISAAEAPGRREGVRG